MQMQQLSAGRGALTAVRTGVGRDLVILHSLLADRHAFDPVLEALAAKHRVTLFNLPGFHGSQPAMLALMDAYLATIEDGFDEFEVAKDAILLGNGFGGTVALAFALAHPERISKLVVSDAAAAFPPEGRQAFAVMAEKVADGGLGSIAEIAAKRVFSPTYLAAHPEKIEERKNASRYRRWSCAVNLIRRHRRRSTSRSWKRWRARDTSNCQVAAIARRSSNQNSFLPRLAIL